MTHLRLRGINVGICNCDIHIQANSISHNYAPPKLTTLYPLLLIRLLIFHSTLILFIIAPCKNPFLFKQMEVNTFHGLDTLFSTGCLFTITPQSQKILVALRRNDTLSLRKLTLLVMPTSLKLSTGTGRCYSQLTVFVFGLQTQMFNCIGGLLQPTSQQSRNTELDCCWVLIMLLAPFKGI